MKSGAKMTTSLAERGCKRENAYVLGRAIGQDP